MRCLVRDELWPGVHISTPVALVNPPEGRPQADEIPVVNFVLEVNSCSGFQYVFLINFYDHQGKLLSPRRC